MIIAHSERRQFFGETDETANKKVKAALAAGLTPIFCVGETLREREAGPDATRCWSGNSAAALAALTGAEFSRIILAYEPVWAIGTGRTATPGNGRRGASVPAANWQRQLFRPGAAAALRILYGGSVKPDNIKGLMAQVDIDGALVGGASLDAAAVCLDCEFLETRMSWDVGAGNAKEVKWAISLLVGAACLWVGWRFYAVFWS